jgi:hypothetical protein
MKSYLPYIFFLTLCLFTNPLLGQQLSKEEENCDKIGISKVNNKKIVNKKKKNKKYKTKFKFKISLYRNKHAEKKRKICPKFR